jgi:hypothetical protein
MLRAPSSHGKSVLLGTDFFFLPSRLPPKSAFTREPSPCKPATPRGSGRHFTSKLYLWAVAGGRHDGKTICAELVGRSRQRPEQSGVDEPRRAENLYAPAVDPDSAGPGRRCRWLLVRQSHRGGSRSPLCCVLDFERNRKSLLEWTRGHEIQPLRSSGTPGGRLGGSHITLLHYFFRDARLP